MRAPQIWKSSMIASSTSKSITSDRLRRANGLIRRWAWLSRGGLPDIGYPHRSPEQALTGDTGGNSYEILPEDDLTAATLNGMSTELKNITRLHWVIVLPQSEIAAREGISVKMVARRIRWIKEQIAGKCLY